MTTKADPPLFSLHLTPPAQPYAEWAASPEFNHQFSHGPSPIHLNGRWDLHEWRCNRRDPGLQHDEPLRLPTGSTLSTEAVCSACGSLLLDIGPMGLGESRAHLAWLLELMDPAEAELFTSGGVKLDLLMRYAIVPVVRALAAAAGAK
jgi:hypothetical protein